MSLFNSFGVANYKESAPLVTTYEVEPNGSGYAVTRNASKAYSFIGMDYATMMKCLEAMLAKYHRTVARLNGTSTSYLQACTSNIVPKNTGGSSWEIDISVSEVDTKYNATEPTNPEDIFADENARDYDDPASAGEDIVDRVTLDWSQSVHEGQFAFYAKRGETFAIGTEFFGKESASAPWVKVGESHNTPGSIAFDVRFRPVFAYVKMGGKFLPIRKVEEV